MLAEQTNRRDEENQAQDDKNKPGEGNDDTLLGLNSMAWL
jgi:hypothetical protein